MSLVSNFTIPRIFLRSIVFNTNIATNDNELSIQSGGHRNELIDEIKLILKENTDTMDGIMMNSLQSKLNDLEFINKYSIF